VTEHSDQSFRQHRTLLYVEDNLANVCLVRQLISRRGNFKFLSAIDGDLAMIMAREFSPTIILMDIDLPGKNGYDVLKLLRDDPITLHIPVIALSSFSYPHDITKGIEAGFVRYLTKPYKIEDLLDALDVAMDCVQRDHRSW